MYIYDHISDVNEVETVLRTDTVTARMFDLIPDDPVIIAIVVILLTLIFFSYLLIRRTILEFRDGMR